MGRNSLFTRIVLQNHLQITFTKWSFVTGHLPLNSAGSNSSSRYSSGGSSITSINNKQILTDRQIMNRLVNMVITDELAW